MSRTFHTDGEITRRDLLAANAPQVPIWFLSEGSPVIPIYDHDSPNDAEYDRLMKLYHEKNHRHTVERTMKWPYYYADLVLENR